MRFDEVELQPAMFDVDSATPPPAAPERVSIFRRFAALLIDVSLFAALALALSPLLPASMSALSSSILRSFRMERIFALIAEAESSSDSWPLVTFLRGRWYVSLRCVATQPRFGSSFV